MATPGVVVERVALMPVASAVPALARTEVRLLHSLKSMRPLPLPPNTELETTAREGMGTGARRALMRLVPVGCTPARAEVIARDSEEEVGAAGPGIIAYNDVMESGGVARTLSDGIDRRVKEADRREAGGGALLIDQGGEATPQGRGTTGATEVPHEPITVNDKHIVGDHSNIRQIAHGRGALVRGHVDALLPSGNIIEAADAAAAAFTSAPIPDSLGHPGTFRTTGRQGRPPNLGDIRIVRGRVPRRRVVNHTRGKASESPEASKKVCPWAIICWKI